MEHLTKINGLSSSCLGALQGYVRGLTLFLLFVNNITNSNIGENFCLFAADFFVFLYFCLLRSFHFLRSHLMFLCCLFASLLITIVFTIIFFEEVYFMGIMALTFKVWSILMEQVTIKSKKKSYLYHMELLN